MTTNDLLDRCNATMEAVRQKEADAVDVVRARYAGKSGHAWRTGPWDRTCVRCGICVRSLAGCRVVENAGSRAVVLRGEDFMLSACLDGDVGEYRSARETAPWEHV